MSRGGRSASGPLFAAPGAPDIREVSLIAQSLKVPQAAQAAQADR